MWHNVLYTLLALLLATMALFTKEIVTFIMLSFVLMALFNINHTLKRISKQLEGRRDDSVSS